jgi:chemotaxis protein MotB
MNRIKVGFLFGLALLVLQGCVSTSTHQAVVEKNMALTEENTVLTEKLEAFSNSSAALQSDNSRLQEALKEEQKRADLASQTYNNIVEHLQESVAASQVTVQLMKSGVTVSLPSEVVFASGSAQLSAEGTEVLLKIADELKNLPYQTLVAGFTDDQPIGASLKEKYPSNWELAGARAAAVVRLLEENGIPEERLIALSFGDNSPVASNDTPEGRTQNRRIEIRLRPVEFSE